MEEKFKELNFPTMNHKFMIPKLVSHLYKELEEAQNNWLHNQVSLKKKYSMYIDKESNYYRSISGFQSIHPAIVSTIEKTDSIHNKYMLEINNNVYSIYFYFPSASKHVNKDPFFHDCVMKIYFWLYLIQPYIRKNCSKQMNIHIWFSNHKKMISKNSSELLDAIHVNTAFTSSCMPTTNIILYRKEEWFKVFIHETFHNLGLDFSDKNNPIIESKINQLFKVKNNNDIRIFESYCEIWAETMHCFLVAFLMKTNFHDFKKEFQDNMNLELEFSLFQCAKILHKYHITYLDLITKENAFEEISPITSYYFIKTIFMFHFSEFEKWCIEHNTFDLIFKFNNKNIHIDSYIHLIKDLYKNKKFVDTLNHFSTLFSRLERKNTGIMNTMRMTINEI